MRVFFFGGRAQARLNHAILTRRGHEVPYVFDHNRDIPRPFECEMFHDEALVETYAKRCEGFVVCMSGLERGEVRLRLSRKLEAMGLAPVSPIHPTAFISETVEVGKGLQTYPGPVVNDFARISDYCILGSNCSLDHDSVIGNGVTVMGAAAIAGEVIVGDHSTIATNATVLPGIRIGRNTIIGAGAVVTKDIPDNVVAVGVPARVIRARGPFGN
jgi:sugar O-acyltransferase (sialic acid O-acetyltransferase NeuD family)